MNQNDSSKTTPTGTILKKRSGASRTKKAKEIALNIATPDVQSIYLGKGFLKEARYLQLHAGYGQKSLKEDVKNGAKPYAPFLETLTQDETQYNIITATNEEDGLRAVAYLESWYLENEGEEIEEEDPFSIGDSQRNGTASEKDGAATKTGSEVSDQDLEDIFDDIDPFGLDQMHSDFDAINEFLGEEDEDDCEDEDIEFLETSSRIPIVPLNELADDNRPYDLPFGGFDLQMNQHASAERPWWTNYGSGAVCILKSNVCANSFFIGSCETISQDEIKSLKYFKENSRVYVVVIPNVISSMDYSVNSCMLEYTANNFIIDSKPQVMDPYALLLLKDSARRHGFAFSDNLDLTMMAKKLSMIDPQYPSAKFDKIMDYLVHIKAPKILTGAEFEKIGLTKMIQKFSPAPQGASLEWDLVGMEQVKKQVNATLNVMRYNQIRQKKGHLNSKFHNVHLFIGAPGTAKTTVAQIMANTMASEGLLPGSRFVSVTGAQLKGLYVGHTAPKVHALFEEYDAILIDEAYSLTSSQHGEMDSFSQEALAQLAVELENHATDKLVIFAGYGGQDVTSSNNLMYQFLEANPGIRSRICSTIVFDSYKPEEMLSIIRHLAKQASLTLPGTCDDKIKSFFAKRQRQNDFGNGREARVFLEQCQRALAQRVMSDLKKEPSEKELNTITEIDVKNALHELTYAKDSQIGQNQGKLGFV